MTAPTWVSASGLRHCDAPSAYRPLTAARPATPAAAAPTSTTRAAGRRRACPADGCPGGALDRAVAGLGSAGGEGDDPLGQPLGQADVAQRGGGATGATLLLDRLAARLARGEMLERATALGTDEVIVDHLAHL
ncbi:hypothetical protein [Salana multivorans]